jgi:hypothetical protein
LIKISADYAITLSFPLVQDRPEHEVMLFTLNGIYTQEIRHHAGGTRTTIENMRQLSTEATLVTVFVERFVFSCIERYGGLIPLCCGNRVFRDRENSNSRNQKRLNICQKTVQKHSRSFHLGNGGLLPLSLESAPYQEYYQITFWERFVVET